MAISEKEYLILSDLAYDNLLKEKDSLSDIYFDKSGKLRSSMMDKKNVDSKTDSVLGINRYADDGLKAGFQGVLESKDYKDVMSKWKVRAVSNEQKNSGYYGVLFQKGEGASAEFVLANRGTEPGGDQFKKDLVMTDSEIFRGIFPQQFEDAMSFYDLVCNLTSDECNKINIAGHSLGGGISQYLSIMGGNRIGDVATWNGVGIVAQKFITINDFWGLSQSSSYIYEKLVRIKYVENNNVVDQNILSFLVFKSAMMHDDTSIPMTEEDYVKIFDILNRAKYFSEHYEFYNFDNVKNYVISSDVVGASIKHVGNTYVVDRELEAKDSENVFVKETALSVIAGWLNGTKENIVAVPTHGLDMFLPFMDKDEKISETLNDKYLEAVIEKMIDDKWDDYASINRWMSGDTTGIYDKLITLITGSDELKLKDNIVKDLKEEKLTTYMTDILEKRKYYTNKIESKNAFDYTSRVESNDVFDYLLYNSELIYSKELVTMEKESIILHSGLTTGAPTNTTKNVMIDYQNQNNTIFGTEEKDVIRINDDNSTDIGYIGNKIFAGGGIDFVSGGKGEDLIYGGAGDDWLNGGVTAGNDKDGFVDRLIGGEGDDHLFGGSGYDEYVFDLSEDSGNDVIIDTDKRGKIILKDGEDSKVIQGELYEGENGGVNYIENYGVRLEGVTWKYGKYDESTGTYKEQGTSISILYMNKQNVVNRIAVDNFVRQYTVVFGNLLQEWNTGLKFKSRYGETSEIIDTINTINTSVVQGVMVLGTYAKHLMVTTWSTVSSGFQAAMNTSLNLINKGCKLDPLIFDLDGDGVETSAMEEGTYFDLNSDGSKEKAGWVGKDDGLLVYDKNGNGTIDSGRELFGDATRLRDGRIAESGFEALSEFDTNGDSIVDANDRGFGRLQIWQDSNSDGVSQSDELKSLGELGITSIDLKNETVNREQNGNIEVRKSTYTKSDATTGTVAEYQFLNDIFDYQNRDDIVVSEETKGIMEVNGNGLVQDLEKAMTLDETGELKYWVQTFIREKDFAIRRDLIQNEFVYQWAGVSKIDSKSRGEFIDARKLATLEKFTGMQFNSSETGLNPDRIAAAILERVYAQFLEKIYIDMMVQSHLKPYLDAIGGLQVGENITYDLTHAQEKIQKVIDSDYTYGKQVLHDFIAAFRIYGLDSKSNLDSFCKSFSVQGEDLEWIVNSAGRIKIEGTTRIETIYKRVNGSYQPIGTLERYEDEIVGTSDEDAINGHYGNDVIKAGSGDDFIYGGAGDDSLYGEDGNDLIRGGAGNDYISGGLGNDDISGGDGADNIIAGSGNDIVDGGIGNDNIQGGAGDDNYIYSYGSGNDVIVESSGNDTVIAEFLNINDVNFSNDGLDLVMTVTAIGEKLIIKDYFRSESYRVEKFQFVDGNINFDEILNKIGAIKGTNAAEALSGSTNKIVLGLDGNDFIDSANIAEGGLGNDNIIGSSDNDKLYGGEGNDRLDGKIGDDYLEGESGDDLYIIRRDMGHDTIYDNSGSNNIEFVGIASTEVKLYRISNDLEFRLETQKVLTIRDYFVTQKIDMIYFSDNTYWTSDSLKTKTIYVEGSDLRDNIKYQDDFNYSIITFDNYDTVIAGNNKDSIDGGKGDDYLLGNDQDDVIYGGAGNDKLYGDNDSEETNAVKDFGDIFIQASSDSEAIMEQIREITGNDNGVIFDSKAFLQKQLDAIAEGNDEMHGGLGDDYLEGGKKDDILYGDEGNDHLMGDGWVEFQTETGETNIVYHNGNDTLYGGSGDDYLEGSKGNDKLYGGDGDDILEADGYDTIADKMEYHIGNDTLDGGSGNDTLMGGMGNDTYIFKKGYNHDEIVEMGGDDTLDMKAFLSSEAVFTREMNTLKISVGESDQIKLTDYFLDKENGDTGDFLVETIQFSDITMSYMDVLRKMGIIGTSGNDSIPGNEKDNIIFGESGDDVITDDLGMDRIYGGTGNDIIYSGMENDVVFGEDGKDTIYGGYGDDTIKGGLGNDTIYGGENNDYIEGNEGNDYIDGGYGKDKIYGGTGNDTINSSGDDDIVYGNEGDDILLTESGDDKVYGGEGSDIIKAGEGNDYIIADTDDVESSGNDKVYGAEGDDYIKTGAGDDYLDGNVGTDLMIGGKGSDTYVFGIGYGTDTIMEGGDLSVDTIEMTEGVTKDNVAIKFKKYDLILTIKDTNDKLVISDYFRKDENKIEKIRFFDGSEMDLKSITDQWIIKGTAGNDTLHGTEFDDLIFGYQGDDVIYGYGGNDTLNGGEGNDLLFGGTGNDYLDGETGNDILDGGSGDDELEGGAGNDIYVFAKGYDRDVIIEDRETNPSDKTILQINDIAPSKVSFMKVFDNLEIYAEGTAARLVINDFFKDNRNKIDEIQFTDGTIWSLEDIKNRPISIVGTEEDDFFKANRVISDNTDTIYRDHSDYRFIANAGDGDDIIETGSKNDVIYGEAGNDSIKGMGGNDILRGGIGNDYISGGAGNDIISGDEQDDFLCGDEGNDTIDGGQGNDYIDGGSGDDLLVDNEGSNQIFGREGNDKITTGSGNDYVDGGEGKDLISTYTGNDTVLGYSGNDIIDTGDGNDNISGGDGNDNLIAGTGNDIISGGSGDDVIDAGSGDDIISGNQGDDYFYFGKGDGHDTITEEGWGFDKIVFKENVLISDVKIMKNIFDMIIAIVDIDGNITDSITVKNYFNSPYEMVERILFANGTEWDSFDVSEKLKIIGTSADDIITGTEYGDLIYAEDGNDAVNALGDNDGIRGGLGNDIIHGNTGDDYIYGEAGSDTLYGDEGDDVIEGASGNDIVYGGLGNDIISSGDDKDTIYGEAGNDSIRGGTGVDKIDGGLGNDIIYGNEDSDELYGQEGIDTIYGGEGNDTIEGGADNDFIEGGYGSDILNGGSGDDRIVGYVALGNSSDYSNDDNDIIHGNDGNDNISGDYGNDEIYGDAGNDYIDGGSGNDILEGGLGNDTIIGGLGDDVIGGGDGDDYINGVIFKTVMKDIVAVVVEAEDNDQIHGGAGNDTIIDGLGDTEVFGDSGNDGIRTGAGDDTIHGGEGNDRLYGESGFDMIYGDSGNDELYGGIDSDVLEGGIGNDYLEGGTGEDKYVFGLGFGQDVIVDYDKALENIDKIVFKSDITSSMLDLSRDVYNLIMKVKNTSDMITIKDYFKDEYSKIEVIEFADGTLWGAEKIRERVGIFYGTDLGEEILGSDVNNLMYGLGGADKLYGKEGDDIIEGGLGDDYIEGNEGKDDLKGGLGNDIISGGLDADLIKGDDGNDTLYGDDGNDSIYGDIGDDKIYGGDGSDVIYTGKGNDIAYGDAGDDRIVDEFGDDKIFGGDGNDSIDAGSGDDYVEGGLGNDRINLGAGTDLAYGGDGNDVITGDLSDTVYGDVGDDNISGVYKAFGGDGNDVINSSYIAYGDSGNDSISVTANGFAFGGDGDDSLTGVGGSESLEGGLGNDTLNGQEGNDLLLGQDGNDNLYGGYGDDRLDGGVGNDYLEDISGNDLYFFESGYGNDIIYDKNGSLDRIKFGVGISQNSLNFSNIGYDLVISIKESEDTLTIKDYFKAQEYQIEKFEFFDGSIFKVNDSIKDMNFSEVIGTAESDILYGVKNISGLDGNDNITGSILADTITGGLGNDILVGGLGNDKYVFSSGDGSDTVTDFEDTSNNSDTIYIYGTKANYSIKRENYNLIISSNLNQDKITVVNYYLSDAYKIENVNFSDGTLFSKDDLINLTLLGTDKNDSLIGGYGNDIINGLKGDDYLEGKTGNDTYIYGKGYGNDTIFDESGVDVIKLLEGVSPEEVTLRQVDSNLQLVIETTGEILTIKDYYNPYSDKKIESIVFSDSTSTTWNNEIIAQKRIYKFGDISDNMIDGSDKSDSIYGWEGNDVLNGGAGNDLIFGGYGNDRLTGGVGSDVLDGSYGDDTYYISFDNAKDLIRDSQGTDTIKFSKDLTTDIVRVQRNNSNLDIYAKTSDNTESIIATIENYYTSPYWWDPNAFKVENLQFADKTVWDVNTVDQKAYTFIGNESDEVLGGYDHSLNIIANEGNDTLKGSRYNDTFNGGLGNDLIEGGYGSDTYLFNKGDGKDTISDNSYAGYWGVGDNGTDKIKFGENITLNDIILVKKGNNLELRLKDISNISKDSITVSDYFRKEDRYWAYGGTYSPYTIEQMEFNDGKIINIAELLSPGVLIGDATSGADTLETGVAINSIIYGEAGNDTLIGNNAIDTLYGGDDSDLLVSNDGNDILYGGTGNDTLKAGNGNDFLEGDAGTDRLEGNFGSDVYFFEKGFGIDTIKDDGYSGYWGTGDTGTDKLKFGADIALNDILLAKKGNNLELRFNNIDKLNTDKIIIEDYFKREERYWAYGGAFDPYKIEKVEFSNGDVIDLTSMFTKGIIIDEITENADVVNMNIQYDGLIFGGKGNDQITGNSGNDKLYGEEDNDILSGGAGDDILSGGLGNDIINSGTGNNVIIYNLGEGIDTIKISANSNNTLKLGEGILRENVVITREGHNLVIFDGQSTDKVIVENWYYGKKLNEIQFSDGSSMDLSTLHNQGLVVRGTENADEILGEGTENDELHGESGNDTLHGLLGNDTLYGESGDDAINGGDGNDIIVGGTGNDTLQGGANDDLYIFNKEDGQDIIYDHLDRVNKYWWGTTTDVNYYNAGSDTIKFGEGIVKEDLWVKLDGNNLQIGIKNADKSFEELSDKITIKDFKNSNSRIEFLEFSNGVKLGLPNIISLLGTTLDDNVLWEETSVNLSTLDGNDNITTGSYDDIIDLGRGNDKLNSGAGQDIVHGNEGNDTIFTSTGNDLVYGEDGEDTIDGGEGNDSLYGGNGNDTLTGGTGDDLISGGSGKDILIGNLGSNIYAFNLGDGDDTIKSIIGSFDIIQFGEGVFKDNISFTREGHNLIVRTSNAVDKIVVENWYLGNKLEKILFADGTEMLKEEIHTKGLVVKDILAVNQLTGEASENDVLYGLDGDDIISGGFGNDTLYGDEGNDTIDGGADNDLIYGGNNNDILVGGLGNDILVGGIGADILSGGSGNNIYEFSLGDGQDVIRSNTGSSDTLKLAEGMTRDNISFTREGHNLIITSNETDKIIVENWYLGNKLEKILFADGTEILKDEIHIKGLVVKGTSTDDTLNGEGTENDVLYGLDGNDTLNGLAGNDTLVGGLENDILVGGLGNNTYEFSLGDGQDTIRSTIGSSDILKLSEGMTRDNISFTREGHNLIVITSNVVDKIVVENWYLGNKLEKILFADGTEMIKDEIHIKGLVVKGTSTDDTLNGEGTENDVLYGLDGNDILNGLSGDDTLFGGDGQDTINSGTGNDISYGQQGNDTIFGNEGNDILQGNEGNDSLSGDDGNDILVGGIGNDTLIGGIGNNIYEFSLGDGQDTIKSTIGSSDTLKLAEGMTRDNISFTREGHNLIIISNGIDKITVENWYLGNELEKILFADGTEMLKDEIHIKGLVVKGTSIGETLDGEGSENDVLYGLEGNDTLNGLLGNDILIGGKGNDILVGGLGNNTYEFSLGDGEDMIRSTIGSSDTLKLAEGMTRDNISFTREGHNLIVRTSNGVDKITVENWYLGNKLEKILFTDGTEMLKDEIHIKGLVVKGTSLGETLDGEGSENDVLYGLDGNDTLNGLSGNDILIGGKGNDTLVGGLGNNTYEFSLGDGQDIIKVETSNENTETNTLYNWNWKSTQDWFGTSWNDGGNDAFDGFGNTTITINGQSSNINYGVADGTTRVQNVGGISFNTRAKFISENILELYIGAPSDLSTLMGLSIGGNLGSDGNENYSTGVISLGGKEINYVFSTDRSGNDPNVFFMIIPSNNEDVSKLSYSRNGDNVYGNINNANFPIRALIIPSKQTKEEILSLVQTIPLFVSKDILNLGEGITKDNISFTREGHNLIIITPNLNDKIIIENWYLGNKLHKILFSDGTELSREEIHIKGLVVKGTSLGETLDGEGSENDVLYGLEGNDTLNGLYGNDVLYGGSGDDIIKGGEGNDTSYGGEGSDNIYGDNGDDTIYGDNGNDIIEGGNGDDILYGGEGNDVINSGNGNNLISGGLGDDILSGGLENNIYNYSLGEGNDTITATNLSNNDKLVFSNISSIDIKEVKRVGIDGKDVVITFKNNETITLISQNISNIESFVFTDKIILANDLIKLVEKINGSENNDHIFGYERSEVISAGLGDDTVYGNQGNDIIYGNEGLDKLYGNEGADSLYGNQGNDILEGSEGNDTLDGGEGDDTLSGGFGNDTYIFRVNNGNDIIQENDDFGNSDKIILEGLNKSDITLERIENTLIIIMNKTGETLTINDYFSGVRNKVENIVFQDGSIWDKESVKDYLGYDKNSFSLILNSDNSYNVNFKKYNIKFGVKIFKGDDGLLHSETSFNYSNNSQERLFETLKLEQKIEVQINNYLDQLLKSNIPLDILSESFNERFDEIREITVQCLEFREDFKEDAVLGNLKSLNLEGDTDENLLEGDILEDILDGGLGNDVLIGKSGNDTYIFGKGYGEDTILDFDSDKNSQDVIQMRDIASSEAVLTRNNFDLEISCGQDKLIVKNYFDGLRFKIEKIEFSDNVTWTREDINFKLEQNIDMYSIKVENDSLFKVDFKVGNLSVTLNFSLENGFVKGGTLISYYNSDLAEYNAFIASKEYKILSSQVSSLVSQFTESNMPLSNWKTNLVNDMDNLKELIAQNLIYSDINFDYSVLTSNLLSTDGDDSLRGTNKGDILDGGLGNDILEGGLGNDKYIFAKGYGEDTIIENDSTTNNLDIIEMKDITSEEAILSKEGLNLLITCGNDKLIVQDYFSSVSNKIEKIVFSDGITYLNADIESKIGISKNDFNISIISDSNFLFSFTRSEVTITVIYLNGKFGCQLDGFQEAIDNFTNSGEKGILSSQVSEYANQIFNSDIDLNNCISSIENNMDFINNIIKNSFKIEAIVEGSPEPEKLEYIGTDLNDIFTGNSNNEIFDGKLGDDTLEGKAGDDTYIFGKGYGVDTIYEDDFTIGNIDTLKLKDILLSEIIALRNGDNLEIAITNSTDKVILNNYFGNSNNKIEKIEFADGTILDNKTLYQMMGLNVSGYRVAVTDVGFTLVFNTMNVEVSTKFYIDSSNQLKYDMPTFKYDSVDEFNNFGSTGWPKCNVQLNNFLNKLYESNLDFTNMKDVIKNNEELFRDMLTQSFEFKQETKMSYLTQEISYEGDTTVPANMNVLGSGSSNILTGDRGNDILDGLAGNDMLDGGTGNDTYIFGKGYGIDTIYESDSTVGNIDTIKMKDMTSTIAVAARNGNNLEITATGFTDKLIVSNYFSGTNNKVEKVVFSDNIVWDKNMINQKAGLNATSYKVELKGTTFDLTFVRDNVTVKTTFSVVGGVSIASGSTYSGTTTNLNAFTAAKKAIVTNQITQFKTDFINAGLGLTDWNNQLTANSRILNEIISQSFEFKGTSVVDTMTATTNSMFLSGGSGTDVITGNTGNDVLIGGAGNDTLKGAAGNDTYIFGRGDGIDTVTDTAGADILRINANPLDLIFAQTGTDLDISINGTTDKVTVKSWFSGATNQIEKIVANDTELLLNTSVQGMIQAMSAFDSGNQMTWSQSIQNKPKETNDVLSQYWGHQTTMVK